MVSKSKLLICLERQAHDRLRAFAENQGTSMTAICETLIDDFLDRIDLECETEPPCPAAEGDHLFCVHCPCQPPCRDWSCDICINRLQGECACWNQGMREEAGWGDVYEQWQRGQETAERASARIKAAKAKGFTHPWAWCQGSFAGKR